MHTLRSIVAAGLPFFLMPPAVRMSLPSGERRFRRETETPAAVPSRS